jgi:hypothetical protein
MLYKLKDHKVNTVFIEVKLAKCDSTVHTKSAATYKVQGYPTIFFFHKGEKIDYKGQRTK